tara:strand:+ start:53 stop:268 length:216 start_codon:yes stop_codon:yes gene_type:complete
MAKQKDIWKFNDDEWKVHIESSEVCDLLSDKFNIKPSTKYYAEGTFEKETSWDFIVDNRDIKKVKDFLKNY